MKMNDKNKRIHSEQYFHVPPENLNCALAILKGFQSEFGIQDQEIEEFISFGGGRALDGICGALYTADQLLRQVGKQGVTKEFEAKVGKIHCKEIKALKFPCIECVRIADNLLENKIK